MTELTLESLAKRVEEIERKLADPEIAKKDWRRTVGMFDGSEFMKEMDREVATLREVERLAAREGRSE